MSLKRVTPTEARHLLTAGALLVDIREPDEHAREAIPGALSRPLSTLETAPALPGDGPVVFHCKSGARTTANAARLEHCIAGREAYLLAGGLDAWKADGLPTALDRRRPLELNRQVQIGAGGLALLGTLLGVFVSPWFLIVPAFVGAGLLTAGITGFCGMARLLVRMPWNRATYGVRPA